MNKVIIHDIMCIISVYIHNGAELTSITTITGTHCVYMHVLCNTLNYTATPVVDYTPVSITLVFPVGSGKSHQICASVSIIDNVEINSDRAFSLKAKILSPSFASIGGSAWNTANIVEAVIIDDDGMHIQIILFHVVIIALVCCHFMQCQ